MGSYYTDTSGPHIDYIHGPPRELLKNAGSTPNQWNYNLLGWSQGFFLYGKQNWENLGYIEWMIF